MALFEKNPLIRSIYLYLFALVGLALIIIGSVRLLDLGLKVFIFKEADKPESVRPSPPYPPFGVLEPEPVRKEKGLGEVKITEKKEISAEEKEALQRWLVEYQAWQEEQKNIDYLRARREREASNSLAFIIIGFPLYLYHWVVIKRDRREQQRES
jgi:hypothetical protein